MKLKAQAEKAGLTLKEFVNILLAQAVSEEKPLSMDERMTHLEEQVQTILNNTFLSPQNESLPVVLEKKFTDKGARAYTKVAIEEFRKYTAKKEITLQEALEQLRPIAAKYQGNLSLIVPILVGLHELTGDEMHQATKATGNCPMMKTLQDWTGEPLPLLGRAFVDAMVI